MTTRSKLFVPLLGAAALACVAAEGDSPPQLDPQSQQEEVTTPSAEKTAEEAVAPDSYLRPGRPVLYPGHPCAAVPLPDGCVRVFHYVTGKSVRHWRMGEDPIKNICFSPDGEWLVATFENGTATVLDTRKEAVVAILSAAPGGDVCSRIFGEFSSDGSRLLVWSNVLLPALWRTADWSRLALLDGHEDRIISSTWSWTSEVVATSSLDGTVRLWDGITGDPLGGPLLHAHDPNGLSFNPEGSLLAVACDDGYVVIWDLGTRRLLREIHYDEWYGDMPFDIARFSPDGGSLLTTSRDGYARCLETGCYEEMWVIDYWGGRPCDLEADFVLDGKFVLIEGNLSGEGKLVDAGSGATVLDLGHMEFMYFMYPIGEGRTLVGSSRHATYGIDLETGRVRYSRMELEGGGEVISADPPGTVVKHRSSLHIR